MIYRDIDDQDGEYAVAEPVSLHVPPPSGKGSPLNKSLDERVVMKRPSMSKCKLSYLIILEQNIAFILVYI